MIRLLALLVLSSFIIAEEEWKPLEHPAFINRQLIGYTEAVYSFNLASEVNARIKSIPLDIGETAKGEQFIHLDDSLALIDVKLAEAQLKQAQSQLQTTKASLSIAQSEAKYRLDEKQRIDTLIKQAVASDEQRDAIVFRSDQARFAVLRQQASVENSAQQVAVAQAQLARAQEIQRRHHIHIPPGWTVSKRYSEANALAQIGAPIVQLQDLRTLIIRFALSEAEVTILRQQKNISVTLNQSGKPIACTIKSISPEFNAQTRKREVILQAPASLFPESSGGISCTLQIAIPDPHQSILIPKSFIVQRFDQNRVQLNDKTWLPIIILRWDQDMAVVQHQQFSAESALIKPQLGTAD